MFSVMNMKRNWSGKLSERFDLPNEALSDMPLTRICGRQSVGIENHHGIVEYTEQCVRVSVRRGTIAILGERLSIARMTRRCVEIRGAIRTVELE